MNFFENANRFIRQSEASAVNLLSAVAPWGAPLAPAFMAFHSMRDRLGFDPWVALIIAGVIEILGLATVATTVEFWQHNRRRDNRAAEKQLPTLIPAAMFVVYLLIVMTVNVLLEAPITWLYTEVLARGLLTLLSVPAAVTLAIRTLRTDLLSAIESETEAALKETKSELKRTKAAHELAVAKLEDALSENERTAADLENALSENERLLAELSETESEPEATEASDESEIERFECNECDRVFHSQNALNAHARYHQRAKETNGKVRS